ncbi:ASKHA domain-containing protein [candidate division KSB1 bacterium]|nr:ASKHA domain-containing protein [candidate division KSB1 bacterium]
MSQKVSITFKPLNQTVAVPIATTLLKAAEMGGIKLISPCGGNGICGKCRVKLLRGQLEEGELLDGFYLACKSKVTSNIEVEIPSSSKMLRQKILIRGIQRAIQVEANLRKTYLELKPPTIEDQQADFERIRQALELKLMQKIYAHGEIMPLISHRLRESDFKITVITDRREIIGLEKGDTTADNYGVAFDIGTTTVAGLLVNLGTGEILAAGSRTNPQAVHGDDVIARIDFSETPAGLAQLRQEIRSSLNDIIQELCRQAGIAVDQIYEVTLAGNTTMNHLFHGVPCSNIARAPYIPVYRGSLNVKAFYTDLQMFSQGNVFTLPNVAGYVGADITAGILASGMHESETLKLLVDIGTNGEIALGNHARIVVCSTAAGPAFEGARLSSGMRGAIGAIEHVVFTDDVEFSVIGNQSPLGICGTGVIDVVAELLKIKALDETGRLLSAEELAATVPATIRARFEAGENGNQFRIATRADGQPILFTQRDIREVQLAKAAIFAGIQVLLKAFGVTIEAVDRILLAGAFGNYIRPHQARQIGLLPKVPDARIQFIGNAAIEGALRVLLSRYEREIIETVATETEYLELSTLADFHEYYMQAMFFDPEN